MKSLRLYSILVFVLIMLGTTAFSQQGIKLRLSGDTVKIGENLGIKLELRDANISSLLGLRINIYDSLGVYQILMPEDSLNAEMDDGIPDFEITDFGDWEDHGSEWIEGNKAKEFSLNDKGEIENILKVKIWDPGAYLIIVEELRFRDGDSLYSYFPDLMHGKSVLVDLPLNEGAEMAPIKDIIKEGYHWTDFWWIYIILAIIIILLLLIRYAGKRKKAVIEKPEKVIIRPAHEIALEKLDHLKEEKLWQKGEIKEYQSQLTYIIREYLENRFYIHALESTSSDIARALRDKGLKDEDKSMLQNILQIADLVKFAKAKPEENVHEKFFNEAIDFVDRTKFVQNKNNKE